MVEIPGIVRRRVHCRIGSSEKHWLSDGGDEPVHCRIGSSENFNVDVLLMTQVHCRIGSSEMARALIFGG